MTQHDRNRRRRNRCFRSLPFRLFAVASLLGSPALGQSLVDTTFNPFPRKVKQVEWLEPNFPAAWGTVDQNSTNVITLLYTQPGISPFAGMNPLLAPSGTINGFTSLALQEPHRFAYRADPSLTGETSFFFASINLTTNAWLVSRIEVVDHSRAVDGPVLDDTCIWDSYTPAKPVQQNLTVGDVYVDAAIGDDTNNGTSPLTPVKTIQRGVDVLKAMGSTVGGRTSIPGKVMLIRGGEYRYRDNVGNNLEIARIDGTQSQPVVIAGYAGEEAIIDGFSLDYEAALAAGTAPSDPYSGLYGAQMESSTYVTLENLTFRGWRQEGVSPDVSTGVQLRFLTIHNCGKWGIQAFGNVNELVIEGCKIAGVDDEHGIYIAGFGSVPTPSGGFESGSKNIRLSFNEIQHTAIHGIHVNGLQNQVLVNHNRIQQAHHGAIQCTGTPNLRIWNNVCIECNQMGISIFTDYDNSLAQWAERYPPFVDDWKQNHFQGIGDIEVAYNTIFVPPTAWRPVGVTSSPADFDAIRVAETSQYEEDAQGNKVEALVDPHFDVTIRDNVIANQSPTIVYYQQSAVMGPNGAVNEFSRQDRMLEGITFRNNIMHSANATSASPEGLKMIASSGANNVPATFAATIQDLEVDLPTQWSSNLIGADPSFTAPAPIAFLSAPQWWPDLFAALAASNFVPLDFSPAIDAGDGATMHIDALGTARPQGTADDLGAYEVQ